MTSGTQLINKIHKILKQEKINNKSSYANIGDSDLPYQSYDRIGLNGVRWTPEKRIKEYKIDKFVTKGMHILDIGCNTGFMLIELSKLFNITGIGLEPNKYLINVADIVAKYLKVDNRVKFINKKFKDLKGKQCFDMILCLAVVGAHDNREEETPYAFFKRCMNLLKGGGIFVYESVSYHKDDGQYKINSFNELIKSNLDPLIKLYKKKSGRAYRYFFIGRKIIFNHQKIKK